MWNKQFVSMMLILLCLVSMIGFRSFAPIVLATTYEYENFENFPTGWTVYQQYDGTFTKTDVQKHGDSYSALVNSTGDRSMASGYTAFTTPAPFDFHLQMWIWVSSSYQAKDMVMIETAQGSGTNVALLASIHYVTDHFEIHSYNGAGQDSVCEISPDQWNGVDIYYDQSVRKAKFYLNGIYKGEFQTYTNQGNQALYYVGDVTNQSPSQGDGVGYYDDVLVDDNMVEPSQVTIGEFEAPSTIYGHCYDFLNVSIQSPLSNLNFINATISIDGSILLLWENSTDTFSENSDPSNYAILDVSTCIRATVNDTAYKLSFNISFSWSYPEGYISADSNTKVFDIDGSSSGTEVDWFYYEPDIIVNDINVDDPDRIYPNQTITFTGKIYNEGRNLAPQNVSDITAYIEISPTEKGSDSTIDSDGNYSITVTGENATDSYTYNAYAKADSLLSAQNQTKALIVDRIKTSFNTDDWDVWNGTTANFTLIFTSDFDSSSVQGAYYTVTRNSTSFQTNVNTNFTDVQNNPMTAMVYQFIEINATDWNITTIYALPSDVTELWYGYLAGDGVAAYIVARFTFSPTAQDPFSPVLFNGSMSESSNPITNYTWSFGDGNVTEGAALSTISHTYVAEGNYTVVLNITDVCGFDAFTFEDIKIGQTLESAFMTLPLADLIVMLIVGIFFTTLFLAKGSVTFGAISFVAWLCMGFIWLLINPISYEVALLFSGIASLILILTVIQQLDRLRMKKRGLEDV